MVKNTKAYHNNLSKIDQFHEILHNMEDHHAHLKTVAHVYQLYDKIDRIEKSHQVKK